MTTPSDFESLVMQAIPVLAATAEAMVGRIRARVDQIHGHVQMFVTGVSGSSDLFAATTMMFLSAWKKHKCIDIDNLLNGLQTQSLHTVHSYLSTAGEPPEAACAADANANFLDPYKEVTKQLQELWSMKPRKCSRCHKESIFAFVNAQTRSADEGMTTFVMCGHCGHRHRL